PKGPIAIPSNTEKTIRAKVMSRDFRFKIPGILNAILTEILFTSRTSCIEGYLHQLYARGILLSKWTMLLLSKKAVHLAHSLLLQRRKDMRIQICCHIKGPMP